MSLLTCITNAANIAQITPPPSIVNSRDRDAQRLLTYIYEVGLDLINLHDWSELCKEYSITVATSTVSYALPADFERWIFDTNWDANNHWRMIGPLSPQEWQLIQNGVIASLPRKRFRIKSFTNKQFFISPTPSSTDVGGILISEYISKQWFHPKTWAASTLFNAGSYCFYNGNLYSTTAGGTTGSTPPTHTSSSASDGGVTWIYSSSFYSTFASDSDEFVFDELLVAKGAAWRYLRGVGGEYRELQQEFYNVANQKYIGRVGATTRSIVPQAVNQFIGPYNIPDTGYGS